MLELSIADAVLTWNNVNSVQLKLPQNEFFDNFDLTVDQSKDIEKIEKSN